MKHMLAQSKKKPDSNTMINLDTRYSSLYEITDELGRINTKSDTLSPYLTADGSECVLIGITDEDEDTMIIKANLFGAGRLLSGDWMELIGDIDMPTNFDNSDNDPGYGQLRYGGKIHLNRLKNGDYIGEWTMEDGSSGLWMISAIAQVTN